MLTQARKVSAKVTSELSYTEYIAVNQWGEAQAGIKIAGRNINSLICR